MSGQETYPPSTPQRNVQLQREIAKLERDVARWKAAYEKMREAAHMFEKVRVERYSYPAEKFVRCHADAIDLYKEAEALARGDGAESPKGER